MSESGQVGGLAAALGLVALAVGWMASRSPEVETLVNALPDDTTGPGCPDVDDDDLVVFLRP